MTKLNANRIMHPGEFLLEAYIKPSGQSVSQAAREMLISPATLSRLVNGRHEVSIAMAFKLSKKYETSPEFWINMQTRYNIANFKSPFSDIDFKAKGRNAK